MKRHGLSALFLVASVVLGLGTSMSAKLDAKWNRSEDAVTVLNANEFEWRGVGVIIWTLDDSWTAQAEVLEPGQSLRVAFADLRSDAGTFRPEEQPDALVAVVVDKADGQLFSKTLGLAISELPLERGIRD